MTIQRPPRAIPKAECHKIALKYRNRSRWEMHSPESFAYAKKKGWLKEFCTHMTKVRATWDLKQCKVDALRFTHLVDWKSASNKNSGYSVAERNGWLDECCEHMVSKPPPESKWTLEACKADALKHKHRGDWSDAKGSAYAAATRNGWLEECCSHMIPNVKWTLEACKTDALNYESKTDWYFAPTHSYAAAYRNGWLEECCTHMTDKRRDSKGRERIWNLTACMKDALSYKSRGEWSDVSGSAYNSARINGWLDVCCLHMKDKRSTAKIYTAKECAEDAKPYKYKTDWRKASPQAYKQAWQHGWLDECCAHMTRKRPSPKAKQ